MADKRLPVIELFGPTIQGEGPLQGVLTHFVRLGGCDFRCKLCDSMHAVDPKQVKTNRTMMSYVGIVKSLASMGVAVDVPWVTLSGGNPVIHDLDRLITALHNSGYKVAIETQGSYCSADVLKANQLVISPKGPGLLSGVFSDEPMTFGSSTQQNPAPVVGMLEDVLGSVPTALKFVVFSYADVAYAGHVLQEVLSVLTSRKRFDLWDALPVYLSVGNFNIDANKVLDVQDRLLHNTKRFIESWAYKHRDLKVSMAVWEKLRTAYISPQMHVLLWGNALGR